MLITRWILPLVLLAASMRDVPRASAAEDSQPLLEADASVLAISSQGSLAVGRNATVSLRDRRTGKTLHTLEGHTGDVHALAFSPDGALLASAGPEETILWDTKAGARKQVIVTRARAERGPLRTPLEFSPDGTWLALKGDDRWSVRLWDVKNAAERLIAGVGLPVAAVAFSPDGRTLAIGTAVGEAHGAVILYGVEPGTKQHPGVYRYALYSDVVAVAFAADGRRVMSFHVRGEVAWLDLERADAQMEWEQGFGGKLQETVFAPGAKRAARLANGRLQVHEVGSWRPLVSASGVRGPVVFAPDGRSVAAFGEDQTVRVWALDPNPDATDDE